MIIFQKSEIGRRNNKKSLNGLIDVLDVDFLTLGILPFDREVGGYLFEDALDYIMENEDKKIIGLTKNFYSTLPKTFLNDLRKEGNEIKHIRLGTEEYAMVMVQYENVSSDDDLLGSLLSELLGNDLLIPYAIEDRKKKFPKAFKELEPYMRKYLKKKIGYRKLR